VQPRCCGGATTDGDAGDSASIADADGIEDGGDDNALAVAVAVAVGGGVANVAEADGAGVAVSW